MLVRLQTNVGRLRFTLAAVQTKTETEAVAEADIDSRSSAVITTANELSKQIRAAFYCNSESHSDSDCFSFKIHDGKVFGGSVITGDEQLTISVRVLLQINFL